MRRLDVHEELVRTSYQKTVLLVVVMSVNLNIGVIADTIHSTQLHFLSAMVQGVLLLQVHPLAPKVLSNMLRLLWMYNPLALSVLWLVARTLPFQCIVEAPWKSF